MSRKQAKPEAKGPSVPAYIVTFSDMVTLLLTFFVMLLSLAQMQDPELFEVTRDAFVKNIRNFGLGSLMGQKMSPNFNKTKSKYSIDNPDDDATRTVDSKEENIRRLFNKLAKNMKTRRCEIADKKFDFSATRVSFSPGKAELNESSKLILKQFVANLQQDTSSEEVEIYVLGLAGDVATAKKQLILSAKRGRVVEDFLTDILPSQLRYPVCSWGGGAGEKLGDDDSKVSKGSQIMISVQR